MKVLFCGLIFSKAPELLRKLLPDDDVINCPSEEVPRASRDADVLIPLMHKLEPETITGTKAGLIQQWGVGLEGVDIPAASAGGILVCNVPGDQTPNADSTAEHGLFLMLALARKIHECSRAFGKEWGAPAGEMLMGGTALIVGLGKVGTALARKLSALGMNVTAVRRTPRPDLEAASGITEVGDLSHLNRLTADADFVISTVSLNDETKELFDRHFFQAMKPSSYFVNISRGPVVNEPDLLDVLRRRRIAGAGLDVYAREPIGPGNPFLALDNVVATPHIGGATRQNYEGVARKVAENLLLFKKGMTPMNCVNLEQVSRKGH